MGEQASDFQCNYCLNHFSDLTMLKVGSDGMVYCCDRHRDLHEAEKEKASVN